jgi:uncharacterized protein
MSTQADFVFHGRQRELGQLRAFLDEPGPGFTHLRGRRRVGKTEVLKRIRDERQDCFYFMGRGDEDNRRAQKRFAREWDAFTGVPRLTRLKLSELDWDELFLEVAHYVRTTGSLTLLLDEVQWLAGRGAGFCGLIKQHWSEWKKTGSFKLVLTGSSNRFFHKYTDGELAILRGLRTHATIWVLPFTLAEVQEYYFPDWTLEEVCLIFMMLGGVPYYLENIRPERNFIRAVNRSIFCRGGIFLEEVDALLKLETTVVGARKRVKEILSSLGQDGATEATITKRTGFRQEYVHKALGRLLDYDLVRERWPLGEHKKNRSGVRYYTDDFYLNFYFQVLRPLDSRIRANERGLIFPAEVLGSNQGYYIRDFSGQAFELLIASVLARGCNNEAARTQPIFDKLGLRSGPYEWGTYWQAGRSQIDLVVVGLHDREIRIIEAKWISRKVGAMADFPEQALRKQYSVGGRRAWPRSHYLVLSKGHTAAFGQRASAQGVQIIELEDLWGQV